MQIEEMRVADLIPYENNPRKNDEAVEAVAASIKEFGFKVPIIVDADNVIIAGHTRLKAAQLLGMESVPVIRADDLTDEQVKAFRLADNKTSELAVWDFEQLQQELDNITGIDMNEFGFATLEEAISEIETLTQESKSNGYSITYEIVFNDEAEKNEWYEFLSAIKREYPDLDTISERIIMAVREWTNGRE